MTASKSLHLTHAQEAQSQTMDITQEHPEYIATKDILDSYADFYTGGFQIKERACNYLERRQKEPFDVYHERLSRAFYENYIGSIIDWYAATLFRREPIITVASANNEATHHYAQLVDNCDLRGNSLTTILRRQFSNALIDGKSYILLDYPKQLLPARSRGDEDSSGCSRAYLADFARRDVINWSKDQSGAYDWVVLRQSSALRSQSIEQAFRAETTWLYLDRSGYRVYENSSDEGSDRRPQLVDAGQHALSSMEMVPLFELALPEGLWLMNKAAQLQIEHFNKSNALSWALSMGLFAMPVVYSEKEWKQIVGESYYIQLGPNDRFGWTEPEGKVFQIASENLARLKEEIYRVCYLLQQARPVQGTAVTQSGLSKQQDHYVTHEVLRAYGDLIKDYCSRILRFASLSRRDDISIGVEGLDQFDVGTFSGEIEDAERLLRLGIESPTLRAQIFKKLVAQYLCDARQEIKSAINGEIDAFTGSNRLK